jgi:sulfotransferase family protein
MKIIGAGMPRTATTTQKVALEMLGLNPYHMVDLMTDWKDIPLWDRAADGEDVWDELLAGKDSTVDFPGARFYQPLMDKYPDAFVLLSVRDSESWVRSMQETICQIYFGDVVMRHLSDARILIDENWRDWIMLMRKLSFEGDGAMADAPDTREGLIRSFERWNAEVKSTVPAERLLVWEPSDGWEPICERLGVAVPDEPFPHVNDVAGFRQGIYGGAVKAINDWWEEENPRVEATTRA